MFNFSIRMFFLRVSTCFAVTSRLPPSPISLSVAREPKDSSCYYSFAFLGIDHWHCLRLFLWLRIPGRTMSTRVSYEKLWQGRPHASLATMLLCSCSITAGTFYAGPSHSVEKIVRKTAGYSQVLQCFDPNHFPPMGYSCLASRPSTLYKEVLPPSKRLVIQMTACLI